MSHRGPVRALPRVCGWSMWVDLEMARCQWWVRIHVCVGPVGPYRNPASKDKGGAETRSLAGLFYKTG